MFTSKQLAAFRKALGRKHRFRASEEVEGAIEVIRNYDRPRDLPKDKQDTVPKLLPEQLAYIADAMGVAEVKTEQIEVQDCILFYELIIDIIALRIIPVH